METNSSLVARGREDEHRPRQVTDNDVSAVIDTYRAHTFSLLLPILRVAITTPSSLWIRGALIPVFAAFVTYQPNSIAPYIVGCIALLLVPLLRQRLTVLRCFGGRARPGLRWGSEQDWRPGGAGLPGRQAQAAPRSSRSGLPAGCRPHARAPLRLQGARAAAQLGGGRAAPGGAAGGAGRRADDPHQRLVPRSPPDEQPQAGAVTRGSPWEAGKGGRGQRNLGRAEPKRRLRCCRRRWGARDARDDCWLCGRAVSYPRGCRRGRCVEVPHATAGRHDSCSMQVACWCSLCPGTRCSWQRWCRHPCMCVGCWLAV
ncbi:hypothetical protein Agub_g5103 [Astrephomene gubernaculifera]|uniref:Uncharacterized protein n=1 Tax=Astrephomene gubernaculifera TaxID=47775 RepID=A0AAD3DLC4_9CHLO|nr:hypothetical protein Agub_g5103 [Astrephomene gubernaculifera]